MLIVPSHRPGNVPWRTRKRRGKRRHKLGRLGQYRRPQASNYRSKWYRLAAIRGWSQKNRQALAARLVTKGPWGPQTAIVEDETRHPDGPGAGSQRISHQSLVAFAVPSLPAKVASPDLSKRDQAIISFNLRRPRYQTDSEKKTC